ncbi:MAG: hypothetical protein H0U95_19470 [Bacteroidetes bacterium]|nr:hypothetical protein [Bacteroidota bacterium]
MKNYIYIFAILLLASCSNNNKEQKGQTTTTDTLAVNNTGNAFAFNEVEFKKQSLPFTIDTLFIQKVDTNNRITYQQVRALGINFLNGELGDGLSYDLNTFCLIDSLKQRNKYVDYINHLDIGMTKTCIAYKVCLINLPENNKLFIWGITNASYEACPFFSGTLLIGTFVNSNKEATHFNIAELSGGGDPPSMMNTQTTANIGADGKIEIISIVNSDDMDVPGEGIERTTYKLEIKGNVISLVDTKKEVLSKEDEAKQDQ